MHFYLIILLLLSACDNNQNPQAPEQIFTAPPTAPSYTLTFVNGNSDLTISWVVSDGSLFNLYSSTGNTNFSTLYSGAATAFYQQNIDLLNTYYYKLQICDAANNCTNIDEYSSVTNSLKPIEPLIGEQWVRRAEAADFSGRRNSWVVEFNDQLLLLGGRSNGSRTNDIWSSSDGINWSQETSAANWSGRNGHSVVLAGDKLFLLAGSQSSPETKLNDVWSSLNGKDWNLETANAAWTARSEQTAVYFNNRIWLIAGREGLDATSKALADIWFSDDGASWIEVSTIGSSWDKRHGHTSIVFDNKMWVIGGADRSNNNYKSDVWSTEDGFEWQLVSDNNAWGWRYNQHAIVYDGKIWIIGGKSQKDSRSHDIWSSVDGSNWLEVTSAADWVGRYNHSSIAFQGKLWIVAGKTENASADNDIWSTEAFLNITAVTTNTISLNWSAIKRAEVYRIYRSTAIEFTEVAITTATSYTDTNLEKATKYYYKMAACSVAENLRTCTRQFSPNNRRTLSE